MIQLSFLEAIRLFEMAEILLKQEIGLKDGQMITYRSLYRQLDEMEKQFIQDRFQLDFLENYEGIRKRKLSK